MDVAMDSWVTSIQTGNEPCVQRWRWNWRRKVLSSQSQSKGNESQEGRAESVHTPRRSACYPPSGNLRPWCSRGSPSNLTKAHPKEGSLSTMPSANSTWPPWLPWRRQETTHLHSPWMPWPISIGSNRLWANSVTLMWLKSILDKVWWREKSMCSNDSRWGCTRCPQNWDHPNWVWLTNSKHTLFLFQYKRSRNKTWSRENTQTEQYGVPFFNINLFVPISLFQVLSNTQSQHFPEVCHHRLI